MKIGQKLKFKKLRGLETIIWLDSNSVKTSRLVKRKEKTEEIETVYSKETLQILIQKQVLKISD